MRQAAQLRAVAAAFLLAAFAPDICAADDADANIEDLALPRAGGGSRDFFYVKAIDGQPVDNLSNYAWGAAESANTRGGGEVSPVADHALSPAPHTITIAARNFSMQPIRLLRIFGNGDEHFGDVMITPLAGHRYRMTGEIGEDHGAVWIIDTADGSIVGQKIEFRP